MNAPAAGVSSEPQKIRFAGIHCNLFIEFFPPAVIVLRISGTDVGEFGEEPMRALDQWLAAPGAFDFFIDAREVRGASIDVSSEWTSWLAAHKELFRAVTLLPGSPFVRITAEFVRRFAGLERIMNVSTDPAVFDAALSKALSVSRRP
jgi:hypothetical protein